MMKQIAMLFPGCPASEGRCHRRTHRRAGKRPGRADGGWPKSRGKGFDLGGCCCCSTQPHTVRRAVGEWIGSRYRPPTRSPRDREDS
jgi:hypothetical protein